MTDEENVDEPEDLSKFVGLHVMTISYDDNDPGAPCLDLGTTSPWLAYSILSAALETLTMIRPPLTVVHDRDILFSTDMFSEDDEYNDGEY